MDLIARLSTAERHTATWQAREADAKRLVQAEFDALGIPSASLAAQPLHVVIESAAAVERAHESAAKTRRDLETSQRKAASDAARKRKALEKAETGVERLDNTVGRGAQGAAAARDIHAGNRRRADQRDRRHARGCGPHQ